MVSQDIINKLGNINADIKNSPEFSQSGTNRAQSIVSAIMNDLKVGNPIINNIGISNSSNNIMSNLGINRLPIKNRLTILSNVDSLKNKINVSGDLTHTTKFSVIGKLEMMKRLR